MIIVVAAADAEAAREKLFRAEKVLRLGFPLSWGEGGQDLMLHLISSQFCISRLSRSQHLMLNLRLNNFKVRVDNVPS